MPIGRQTGSTPSASLSVTAIVTWHPIPSRTEVRMAEVAEQDNGGFHLGPVGGDVRISAAGDIVGRDKVIIGTAVFVGSRVVDGIYGAYLAQAALGPQEIDLGSYIRHRAAQVAEWQRSYMPL